MGIDSVHAAVTDGERFTGLQPVQVSLVAGVEVIRPGTGRAHGVEAVTVFDARSVGTNDALPCGIPEVRVVQAIIVAELVTRDAWGEVTAQPGPGRAHIAQP